MTRETPDSAPADAPPQAGGGKATAAKPCPQCGRPRVEAFRPFCSKRCADVDLARWLKGSYAIPGKDAAEEEDGG